jgi:hypothetical protein
MREPLSPEAEAAWLRPISPEEFERRLVEALRELDGEEGENLEGLLTWFQRRYPTAKERLAYSRRRYEAWVRAATYARGR